ncbi:hemerythrin domain-containing protein [Streptomyces albus subsp. chlorinus]|uniref:hemerythrin domain-containing protein n=1 Tax=Streptomyces albus TaxID=1888 RepID=UPI00156F7925|nr:hemerythrin domain-containing protein [Streptomyces albus]NSC24685.1 hemerythrin domain-containing protein [Streptomyces albus subsp. chlorinus]
MGHGGTVIDELTTDHREVEELFAKIEALPPGHEKRKLYADQATIELVRHSVAEEEYLYPAVRAHVPGGGTLADRELEDHRGAERLMKELEGLESGDPSFDRTLTSLIHEIRSHVSEEEGTLFPRLREAVPPQELAELGDKVRHAKKTAPTRPHPHSPQQPPANKLLAPGAGLVDRIRDALSGRGKEKD